MRSFNSPNHITVDSAGNLYVTEYGSNQNFEKSLLQDMSQHMLVTGSKWFKQMVHAFQLLLIDPMK